MPVGKHDKIVFQVPFTSVKMTVMDWNTQVIYEEFKLFRISFDNWCSFPDINVNHNKCHLDMKVCCDMAIGHLQESLLLDMLMQGKAQLISWIMLNYTDLPYFKEIPSFCLEGMFMKPDESWCKVADYVYMMAMCCGYKASSVEKCTMEELLAQMICIFAISMLKETSTVLEETKMTEDVLATVGTHVTLHNNIKPLESQSNSKPLFLCMLSNVEAATTPEPLQDNAT